METLILKIDSLHPDLKKMKIASKFITKGELVAFPTETVYGLGARADSPEAVKKIFKAKGRPSDNPLIVHIADKSQLYKLVSEIPPLAFPLMKKFWPGPLTLIFPKSPKVPDIISAGLPKIAIRMPANKIALELIRISKCPIAAPSANLSGKPSPTFAFHVIYDFESKIPCIIDGGQTFIGLESTVLDLTTSPPTILRPGAVSPQMIEAIIGKVNLHPSIKKSVPILNPASPGMKYKHYSPNAKIILIKGKNKDVMRKINSLSSLLVKQDKKVSILTLSNSLDSSRSLFARFHEADMQGFDYLLIPAIEEKGLGLAIMNRVKKAASKTINV